MSLRRKMLSFGVAFLLVVTLSVKGALAVPTLQLDIEGGVYDADTQTIVSSGSSFTLYALLDPNYSNGLSDTYYISVSVVPSVNQEADLGFIVFGGTTIDVTEGMDYGVPPLEANLARDRGDLPPHSIFPTYFTEIGFRFSPESRADLYNTQDDAGQGPTPNGSGSLYFASFTVDTSGLAPGYQVHFDLYNTAVKTCTDIDVTQFAPFSHDAESGGSQVPEPGTLLLVGTGLLGLAVLRKKHPR